MKTKQTDPLAVDFRNFLFLIWQHLNLPEPTYVQYKIAEYMQHGNPDTYDPKVGRADVVRAFRGVGKSYIAAAYALWCLYRDPENEKILVVSASSVKAKEFVAQCKGILMTFSILKHLRPNDDQRNSFDRFDVRQASLSQSPSLKAAGITGQITGSRATRILADDIEIENNAKTEQARETLMRAVSEFEAIKVPAHYEDDKLVRPAADIAFLGTPQTEESIYNRLLRERGYASFCVPARYPKEDKMDVYKLQRDDGLTIDILAPFIKEDILKNPKIQDNPTDPTRFGEDDLLSRQGKGKSFFGLQYMLDTTLSDADRYPLKQNDLMVMGVNAAKAPITIQWGQHTDKKNVRDDIPNVGFTGDYFLGPLFADGEWRDYTGSILFVDPAGRGADETAWAIVKTLNGILYVCKIGGHNGNVQESYLKIARDAKHYGVNMIHIAPNFAPGVWISGFQPVLTKVWPGGCTVEEADWAKGRKEERIIDTLEPVMATHRLVVDESVARDQAFIYQLTHITRERASLKHDDRVDALAGAVSYFQRVLEMDMSAAAKAINEEELQDMLDDFMETAKGGPMSVRFKSKRKDTEVYQRRI